MADTTQPSTELLTLPVLPLPNGVVLPGMVLTIALESDEAKAAVEATGDDNRLLLVPRVDGRHAVVGTIATIESTGALPSGVPALVVRAHDRALLRTGVAGTGTVLWLQAEPVHPEVTDEARTLAVELRAGFRELFEEMGGRRLNEILRGLDEPDALADAAGWWPELSLERKIELLETVDVTDRIRRVLGWVKESLAEHAMQEKIRTEVSEGLEKNQREFILRQQLSAIRKELGELDEEGGEAADSPAAYRQKLAERDLPADVRTAAEREVEKLERSSEQSPERGWIVTWLDTVLEIPWGERSTDNLELDNARAVLDADHTGLDEVKDRIVEELAVRKLRAERAEEAARAAELSALQEAAAAKVLSGAADDDGPADTATAEDGFVSPQPVRQGTILTLVGPPGVGKTSLGESIARALDRSFVRVALGGVRDEAEIRGHRRTYVGARPGRLVRAMTEAKTMNPVVLLDEIDKVGNDWRGDPSAALLEVLDPAQNHSFRDHYLEVDLDLSDVIFIATANQLDTIPGPLLDRMDIISLDGYTEDEKVAIARDHLLSRQLERSGIKPDEVTITEPALRRIVRAHTREAGVRSLERALAKVLRKVAAQVAARTGEPVVVDEAEVAELLGRDRFHDTDIADRTSVPGVVTGLAVTGAGGDVLFVEATALPADGGDAEKSDLLVTGQLGDVMKESARIALSYVRANSGSLGIPSGADRRAVHVHFPAGATPKDGPSAGIAMSTALVSLFTGRAVKSTIAMTGEVTLQGHVLPIGGVKQKVMAAHRVGIREVILPIRNEPDIDDIPVHIRDEMTIHLAKTVDQVIGWALEPAAQAEAAA
ncbi:MAG: anti-sigma sporulation factor, LonB [Ilumatobacteraceae bacterium]|nr:anti-sigma sporulation factor, LonB [Ilumatobacteraceae bacterium]